MGKLPYLVTRQSNGPWKECWKMSIIMFRWYMEPKLKLLKHTCPKMQRESEKKMNPRRFKL